MKKAFTYIFNDSGFKFKSFILFIFMSVCIFQELFSICNKSYNLELNSSSYVCLSILCLLCYILIQGYGISVIKSLLADKTSIPFMSLKKDFITGFKFVCACTIYLIPLFCIIGACGFSLGIGSPIFFPATFTKISLVLLIISVIGTIFLYSLVMPASMLVFIKTNSLWSFYKFEEIFKIMKQNKKKYFITVIMFLICGLIVHLLTTYAGVLCSKYNIHFVWLLIILAITNAYLFYFLNYLIADIET